MSEYGVDLCSEIKPKQVPNCYCKFNIFWAILKGFQCTTYPQQIRTLRSFYILE